MQQTAHKHSPLTTAGFAHPERNVGALGIEPGMSVADFGSGSGAYVLAMAEAMANSGHVYAIDVQRDLLQKIQNEAHRRGFKNVGIIWADLEHTNASKIGDSKLDVVLISNLLFQIDNKVAVVAEARRILRPRGKLVIIDWSDSFDGLGPPKRDVVPEDAARALAQEAGFEHARTFAAGAHHYGLIFTAPAPKHA